ncbi:hypothetical protein ACFSTH_13350 [Paenibacillus yanchengensis]|uniref:Uncharacterized protein n=1 Tax=Paenibacillus yanchengensis TaxID=2035833 RepID=A0ABW4YNE8_9BACL
MRDPLHETYKLITLTEEEQQKLQQFRAALRASGLRINIQYKVDMKYFTKQLKQLHVEMGL